MERNELCWCGSGKKYKKCHMPIEEKIMMHAERGEIVPTRKILKTPFQIEKIRKSAELNTAILDEVARQIHVGMSTQEIDDIVYRFTKEHGGIPAPLNYQGFPKSVCTSINNEICHGIPDENIILEEGDIININILEHSMNVEVSDEELAKRKAKWQPRKPRITTGYLVRYASMVTSADRGAILEAKEEK